MKLLKNITVADIIEYETQEDINILEELKCGSLFILLDLIKLGNNRSDSDAENILMNTLNELGLIDTIKQVLYELVGELPSDIDDENIDDINLSFSNILENFYTQLQIVDNTLNIGDFLKFSPRYMYTYASGLQKRYIHNKNKKYMEDYENAAIFMGALTGKLKNCPRLNEDGTPYKPSLRDKLATLKSGGNI